ncbi:MAG: xanthine dehydrogenase family protein molybdopterin-binding subunit [Alphaproteobacteria bacterium]|nr:xanthine dehydrogenase family protein molybdopterin-binding subunit [Alphaproteobacteria bacterium]
MSGDTPVRPDGGWLGASVSRNEDPQLLTGRGLFVGDVDAPDMLHAAFLRSPYAHARIDTIDVSAAKSRDGVVAVYTAEDLGDLFRPMPMVVPPAPVPGLVFNERTHTPLAKDKVRYAGEPIALVVAQNRYIAEDALADIEVDWSTLPVAGDLEFAAGEDAPQVHDGLAGNVAAIARQTKGDYAAVAAGAHKIIRRRFTYEHGMAQPMETRGVAARFDRRTAHLTVWASTQAPTSLRAGLATVLGLGERDLRVIAPFVGGGFGVKVLMYYPEEVLVPWAARELNAAVKWIEDRAEHFLATTQERGQIHDAEIAVDAEGRILGLKDDFLHDNGAYNPYGLTVPINSQCSLFGPYDVPAFDSTFTAVYTNKPIASPFRGAGRQHGVFVIERLIDIAARELGIDRVEMRRRNLLAPEDFPVNHGVIFQDFTELTYDSGDYATVLDRAAERIGYARFVAEEQPTLRAEGKCVGIGIVNYVEGTGIGPYEGARVQVQANGRVAVATGAGTQGQGHYTSFAQLVAEQLGVSPRDVDLTTGDTDQFYWGAGTFASRGAVVAGNAIHAAARAVREKAIALAAAEFECDATDILLEDGVVRQRGSNRLMPLGELAHLANPMRGAVRPGTEPGLESTQYFGPEMGTTASGAHAMIVEVDPETMMINIRDYVVVHDCGTAINPLIVAGQIHGGVAQGIGNAFFEKIVFDSDGQLLNGSLADYLLPTSLDIPRMTLDHTVTLSTLNELGIKGVGEAGAIPVGPLFAQALEDALDLPARGVDVTEIPLSPNRLWELSQAP